MYSDISYTTIDQAPTVTPAAPSIEDLSQLLDIHTLEYKKIDYHFQVGEITQTQGWILHLSIVRSQIKEVFDAIIPVLKQEEVPFKIVQSMNVARSLLDGSLGYSMVGKIITVYPGSPSQALSIAKKLASLTKHHKGPVILTDVHLGSIVYTRYGSFNPVVKNDSLGKEIRYIYDHKMELVKDIYHIPFKMPAGIEWPFSDLATPKMDARPVLLNNRYKPMETFKSDAKGDVVKAIFVEKFIIPHWCVIKQGKINMWSDDHARDITDRLVWQKEFHDAFEGLIPIPKILDFFREGKDTYLVMEYIKGDSLFDRLNAINKHCHCWDQWEAKDQLLFLNYFLQLTDIINKIHQHGYVHRDVTPVNFLINKKGALVAIDSELAYSLKDKRPTPPFESGTRGFMSPQQEAVLTPTKEDDIFGLTATMITIFTGLPPAMLDIKDPESLVQKINYFIQNERLALLLGAGLSVSPEKRPTPSKISAAIAEYKKEISAPAHKHALKEDRRHYTGMDSLLQDAIRGLVQGPTLIVRDLWRSRTAARDAFSEKQLTEYTKSAGLYEGITGVLYFLGRAKKMGFDISSCTKAYKSGWVYLMDSHLKQLPDINPGFYGGGAGIALALKEGMESSLLEDNDHNRSILLQCLSLAPTGLNMESGIAGQGIALLQAAKYLSPDIAQQKMDNYIGLLQDSFYEHSAWVYSDNKSDKYIHAMGFANGNTGILWFLLSMLSHHPNEAARKMAIQSLKMTVSVSKRIHRLIKKESLRVIYDNPFLCDTIQGLALVFIKAYETFKDPLYKDLAESLLSIYPAHICHENFTQAVGLAGLGELYLSAFKVFEDPKWYERAGWIRGLFINTSFKESKGAIYWLGGNAAFPTADLMVGNSGIMHFLLRYEHKEKIGHCLLQ